MATANTAIDNGVNTDNFNAKNREELYFQATGFGQRGDIIRHALQQHTGTQNIQPTL